MANKLKLISRSTPACPNCFAMKLGLDSEGIEYEEVDIAVDDAAVEKYGITSIPVSIIEDVDGNEVMRFNGVRPPELISEML